MITFDMFVDILCVGAAAGIVTLLFAMAFASGWRR